MSQDKNDVVIVHLDRPRELRFGHKALKRLSASSGKSMDDMGNDDLDFGQIEEIYYYGLQRDAQENGETLRLEDMEDLLDYAESYEYLIGKMTEAMDKAMGSLAGNRQAPEASPAKQRPGTGKSH